MLIIPCAHRPCPISHLSCDETLPASLHLSSCKLGGLLVLWPDPTHKEEGQVTQAQILGFASELPMKLLSGFMYFSVCQTPSQTMAWYVLRTFRAFPTVRCPSCTHSLLVCICHQAIQVGFHKVAVEPQKSSNDLQGFDFLRCFCFKSILLWVQLLAEPIVMTLWCDSPVADLEI